jgi:hypothetical protein
MSATPRRSPLLELCPHEKSHSGSTDSSQYTATVTSWEPSRVTDLRHYQSLNAILSIPAR